MHLFAFHFEGEEQVFVRGIRVNAELGEIAEETLTGVANLPSMRKGYFRLGEETLDVVAGEFGHGLIVRPNPCSNEIFAAGFPVVVGKRFSSTIFGGRSYEPIE